MGLPLHIGLIVDVGLGFVEWGFVMCERAYTAREATPIHYEPRPLVRGHNGLRRHQ